jgi:phenylpropionate dioxygenase-like ring-hydroxylating dioxygenase large terminal subunit
MARLWSRVWQVACREEEIPEPGDYVTYEIGDQSILLVRTGPDEIAAHHNACLHRGTRLATGAGSFDKATITCRYHAWCYALDGALVDIVDRDDFGDLPPDLCLKRVRSDRWGGFVWINLDGQAAPLEEFLDPLPTLLAPTTSTGCACSPTARRSCPPTGNRSSTPSTRATTCRAPTPRSCPGPTTST